MEIRLMMPADDAKPYLAVPGKNSDGSVMSGYPRYDPFLPNGAKGASRLTGLMASLSGSGVTALSMSCKPG